MMNQTTAAHSSSRAGATAQTGKSASGRPGSESDVVELSRRRPVPQLLLPIVGPPTAPRALPPPLPNSIARPAQGATRPPQDAILPPARDPGRAQSTLTPPAAFERPVAGSTPPMRESLAMDVFGFALAWVMTTAAGSLVFGHVMARSQPPVVVHVPDASHPAADAPEPAQVSCPKNAWEPPVVAVADLPEAPQVHSWAPPRALALNDVPPAPVARPVHPAQEAVRRAPASPKVWTAAVRHARFAGPAEPSASKAKASPKTLEEWMRASVDPG